MPANYTVEKVQGPEPWTHKASGSVNHDFKLRLTGFEHPVVLTQQPKTPAPEVGQSLSLDIVGDHPIHAGFKKVKKEQQQQFNGVQTLGGGGDDVTRRSIERQCCLKAAVEFECARMEIDGMPNPAPVDVAETAQLFHEWVSQS